MGEYLSPGVYVEEVSSGSKPIEGVGTSTGGFVGIAERGTANSAALITNWTQFVNTFGSFTSNSLLAYGVYNFFNEGGTKCYVTRVADPTKISAATAEATITFPDGGKVKDLKGVKLTITAKETGFLGNDLRVTVPDAGTKPDSGTLLVEQKVKGKYKTVKQYSFANKAELLAITDDSALISITEAGTGANELYTKSISLAGGNNGVPASIDSAFFIGTEADRKGLHSFDTVDEVNIIAIPDAKGDFITMKAGFTYCENRKDCFFIADTKSDVKPSDVTNDYSSSFGALYYPWIQIADSLDETGKKLVPPSGAITGVFSRTDVARGVHKAPAGTLDGKVRSAIGIERIITKGEHDVLNPKNVNVIRTFSGTGICVWGARTCSTADPEWKYVNIRRLFLMIEESIDESSQWVVFEPNDPSLWGNVKRNITAFLTRLWREGALYGNTPDQAFFVKIDEENNPPEVRDAGQLIIEVGVAPIKPAEFVIIRVSQKTLTK